MAKKKEYTILRGNLIRDEDGTPKSYGVGDTVSLTEKQAAIYGLDLLRDNNAETDGQKEESLAAREAALVQGEADLAKRIAEFEAKSAPAPVNPAPAAKPAAPAAKS